MERVTTRGSRVRSRLFSFPKSFFASTGGLLVTVFLGSVHRRWAWVTLEVLVYVLRGFGFGWVSGGIGFGSYPSGFYCSSLLYLHVVEFGCSWAKVWPRVWALWIQIVCFDFVYNSMLSGRLGLRQSLDLRLTLRTSGCLDPLFL
jgi:hypothetical protein